jgi:peptidoglycan/xylan/chitin deacetylase (PgdA/CDA1 family)
MACLSIAMIGMPLEFVLAQIAIHGADLRRLIYFPLLLVIGAGTALNDARAVIDGLVGRPSAFMRTPKFQIEGTGSTWKRSAYAMSADPTAFGEALMAGYAALMIVKAWQIGNFNAIPFLLLYAGGFAYVAIGSATNTSPRRGRSRLHAEADA